jgi:hypothetical protein
LYKKLKLPRTSARTADMPLIDWNAEGLRKLGAPLNAGRPVDEIAPKFKITSGAIQTAISRYNVRRGAILRACMCCQKSLLRKASSTACSTQCPAGKHAGAAIASARPVSRASAFAARPQACRRPCSEARRTRRRQPGDATAQRIPGKGSDAAHPRICRS